MKRYKAICAALLCTLCLLTACGKPAPSSASIPDTSGGDIKSQPDSTASSVSASPSDNSFLVKDIEGNDYDLAATSWGTKYPFMVDYFRSLKREIEANGGDQQREDALLKNWYKITVQDSCVTPAGTPAVVLMGFDSEGNPDPDGPQLTTTIHSAVLDAAAALDLKDAWEKAETQDYLTVTLTVENTGKEETVFYLNSIVPHVIVDGEIAQTAALSEMVTADGTSAAQDGHSFFRCTLSPGQSQEYTAVFYADRRLERRDIYLELGYTGVANQPMSTADPLVYTQTGVFCALE